MKPKRLALIAASIVLAAQMTSVQAENEKADHGDQSGKDNPPSESELHLAADLLMGTFDTEYRLTQLHIEQAIFDNDTQKLRKVLKDFHQTNAGVRFPRALVYAASHGQLEIFQVLKKGWALDDRDETGDMALMAAVRAGDLRLVRWLLDNDRSDACRHILPSTDSIRRPSTKGWQRRNAPLWKCFSSASIHGVFSGNTRSLWKPCRVSTRRRTAAWHPDISRQRSAPPFPPCAVWAASGAHPMPKRCLRLPLTRLTNGKPRSKRLLTPTTMERRKLPWRNNF